jgi:hypothetical protein
MSRQEIRAAVIAEASSKEAERRIRKADTREGEKERRRERRFIFEKKRAA